VVQLPAALADLGSGCLYAVVIKHAGLPIISNPCPHINAELLLASTQYSFSINHKLNISGHMLIWIFCLFWYVELVAKVCPHVSVTLCILSIYGFLAQEPNKNAEVSGLYPSQLPPWF
jgi:hypothetical protein